MMGPPRRCCSAEGATRAVDVLGYDEVGHLCGVVAWSKRRTKRRRWCTDMAADR